MMLSPHRETMALDTKGKRVAIVAGLRTPFAKRSTAFAELSALDLAGRCVRELVQRSRVEPGAVERLVYGQVVPALDALHVAREVVFEAGLPSTVDASSVSRACTTSYRALIDVAQGILGDEIECGIAGGTDSASDVPIAVSRRLGRALIELNRGRRVVDRVKALAGIRPRDIGIEPPALVERTTGLSMGESAEKMARENGISREASDAFAHRSHLLAAAAWADGRYAEEVMAMPELDRDNLVRSASTLESYARLRPVFDRAGGTVTAATSAALTDGASAVLLMREDAAKAQGLEPLAYLRSWAFCAIDPGGQLLMGPALAAPMALSRAGVAFGDLALIDIHEAFAAQVLSVLGAWERDCNFADAELERVNVMGGSLAVGHPFAATGTRQITQLARELRRRGGGLGLATACAAGGLGAAVVLEVE